jgi:hypothetical protein
MYYIGLDVRSLFRSWWTRIETIFRSVCPNLDKVLLFSCSPISSPTSRGLRTVKRRRFNDLGEMKACLQSRCSPS